MGNYRIAVLKVVVEALIGNILSMRKFYSSVINYPSGVYASVPKIKSVQSAPKQFMREATGQPYPMQGQSVVQWLLINYFI